jgi:hypothetical protein
MACARVTRPNPAARLLPGVLLVVCAFLRMGGVSASGATGGLVIYKLYSFDPDSQAEMASYRSYEHFASVDNVLTPSGQTLRILSGQDPVYIPNPGSPEITSEQVARVIADAERRFPQLATKLESLRQEWTSLPKPAPVAESPAPAVIAARPTPPGKAANVLRTRSGQMFEGWSIAAFEGNTVVIKHDGGVSRIPVSELPRELLGLPPEKTARTPLPGYGGKTLVQTEAGKAVDEPSSSATPKDGNH